MQKPFRIKIRVPGTSANLGPGFDIMGLALNIYNEFHFEFSKNASFASKLTTGENLPFEKKDDLVFSSYNTYFQKFIPGKEADPYDVTMKLALPLKGGLGSSASACVAGFLAGNAVHKKRYPDFPIPAQKEILLELAKIESHPDNTTPALLGGLIFAFFTETEEIHYFQKKIPRNIKLFLFCPSFQTDTNHSRKKLPTNYSVSDVIFNMARIGTWMEFLQTKKFKHLLLALGDKIHTPYRIKNEPVLQSVCEFAKENEIGYSLSGSGPTILFYLDKKNANQKKKILESKLRQISNEYNLSYKFTRIKPDNKGSQLTFI